MAEEFGQAMATAEMPDEESGTAAAQAPATAEKQAQAAAPAEKQERAADYDVDLDYNMEWEVETEPAEPDVIIAEPQQRSQGYQGYQGSRGPYEDQYQDERAARTYRRYNKHLFVWLFNFIFGIYGADRFARGQTALGVMKLLTFGGLGMWYLADLIIALVKAYSGEYMNDEDICFDILGRYI